jgi:hypothetical protein
MCNCVVIVLCVPQVRGLAKEHSIQMEGTSEDDSNWREAFVDLDLDKGQIERAYISALEGRRFGEARIAESHCFLNNMNLAFDARYGYIFSLCSIFLFVVQLSKLSKHMLQTKSL